MGLVGSDYYSASVGNRPCKGSRWLVGNCQESSKSRRRAESPRVSLRERRTRDVDPVGCSFPAEICDLRLEQTTWSEGHRFAGAESPAPSPDLIQLRNRCTGLSGPPDQGPNTVRQSFFMSTTVHPRLPASWIASTSFPLLLGIASYSYSRWASV